MANVIEVSDSLESYLKQQCQDPSGLYNWDRKFYRLSLQTGILEIIDVSGSEPPSPSMPSTNEGKLSLRGAKYAKEWSIVTPALGSFGFDIVWTSGRIWSFLADDEYMCRRWVQHINVAISWVSGAAMKPQSEKDPAVPRDPHPTKESATGIDGNVSQSSNRSQSDTYLEAQSPLVAPTARGMPTTLPRHPETSKIIMSPASAAKGVSVQAIGSRDNYFNSSLSNISRIPTVACSSSSSAQNSSPESQSSETGEGYQANHTDSRATISLSHCENRGVPRVHPANLHQTEFICDSDSEQQVQTIRNFEKDWRVPNRKTVEVLEIEVAELEAALSSVESEMRDRIGALTAKYNEMREKDRKIISDLRLELENRAIQVEAEGHDVHAAQLRALRETQRRELACLTDDNIAERKKFEGLLAHERSLTKAAEQREGEVRRELIDVTTKCHRLEAELLRERDAAVLENKSLAADNDRLRREISLNVDKIGAIRQESESKANQSLSATIERMNSKFSDTIQEIERTSYESAKKKLDVQKMQELAAMQIECNRQIEAIRAQNKLTSASEIETLKRNYKTREEQTMMDLKHLESLHSRRVDELESAIVVWRTRAEKAEESAANAMMCAARGSEAERASAEDTMRQLESHASNVENLQIALQRKHEELMESRSREASYREHLNRAIEECRVQRAQNLDSLRQSSCDGAQAVHWKRVAQEVELNLTASNTSLQIARDEAAMLENEVQRLTSQNRSLQEALDRADKIVYGNTAASVIKNKEREGSPAVGGKSIRPLQASARGVSLQDTRMSKRNKLGVKTVFGSPVNDENRINGSSKHSATNESLGQRQFPSKRIMMYA